MIHGALHSAAKELRIRLRDRWALVMWLIVPLAIGGMITSLTGGEGGPQPTAELLVVDEDQSFVSQLMIGALGQGQGAELIQMRNVERAEGEALIAAGDGSALLVVPAGFADAVLNEEPAELSLVTNPAQQILPSIVEEFLKVFVDGVFYLHRVLGDEIKIVTAQVDALGDDDTELFDDALIAELSVAINDAMETLAEHLAPPVLDLADSAEEDDSGGPSFALLFFPGTIFMGLLFASQGLSGSFWQEREDGTLRRLVASPLSLSEIFSGKLLAGTVLLLLLTGILATLGFLYHRLSPAAFVPTVLWLTLSGLVLTGLMSFLQLIAPSRNSASLLTNILIFPLMMVGGAFFPFEALPDWLSAIGQWVPNGFLLERLKGYLIYGEGVSWLATGLPYALAMAVILWALCAWRLRAFAGAAN